MCTLCILRSGKINPEQTHFMLNISFRENYTPELSVDLWPAFVALASTNNVVIEQVWTWLRKTTGVNIENRLVEGVRRGLFNPMNVTHM